MDSIDRKLLDLAQRDGRQSYARYGEVVGLSAAAVHDRLKKLIQSGALKHWSATVCPTATGLHVLAFIRVQLDLPANTGRFAQAVSAMGNVLECHLSGGEWSCLLKVRARSHEALDALINEHIAAHPGITRLQIEPITASPKESRLLPVVETA